MRKLIRPSSLLRILLLAGLVSTSCLAPLHAAEDNQQQPSHDIPDKVSEGLKNIQKLTEAKDYNGAVALIDSLLPTVTPTSYAYAVLSVTKAQTLFQKGDYMGAMDPLETGLKLGETYKYFEPKSLQQFRYYLVSLYSEKAARSKDSSAQAADYDKARSYIERWFEVYNSDPASHTSNVTFSKEFANAEYVYAALLFNIAQRDPHHTNRKLVQEALDAVDKAMRSTITPPENYYGLQLVAYQALGDYVDAADVLEYIVKQKPDNKTNWQQLTAFYLNLAGMAEEKQNDAASRQYYIRAILTMERAHQHGAMNSPKDNFRLVSLYFNVGQYEQAAELLEKGLHDGTIESTPENWKTLAAAYQQAHKDLKAVEILNEASKLFPKSGQYYFLAAQILYSLNDTAGALKALQKCVARDGGDKPADSWKFLIYLAFELQKLDLASDAIEHYAKYPDAKPKEIKNFREAVNSAKAQREHASENAQ